MAHVLYRFYSATGQLMYVGITMNPSARFSAHRGTKDWWADVVGITIENYATRDDLANAERRAIRVERPLHNVVHKHRRKPGVAVVESPVVPIRAVRNIAAPTYLCDHCHQPVGPEAGYIQISQDDVDTHRERVAEWEALHISDFGVIDGSALLDFPTRPRWQVLHAECDHDPDSGRHYWFDVERASTFEELLSWTAHLLDKDWLQHTNWGEFVRAQLSPKALAV